MDGNRWRYTLFDVMGNYQCSKIIKVNLTHPVIDTILLALGSSPETRQWKTERQITGPCLAKVDMVLNISHLIIFLYMGKFRLFNCFKFIISLILL